KLEPNVSTTLERFQTLKTLRDAGIPTVVWLCPLLPFINDTEANLRGILDYCRQAGVKGILCFGFGLTLRQGNREYFYQNLDRLSPGMKERYIKTFGNNYACNSPNNARLMRILRDTCQQQEIISKPNDVFAYLEKFELKERQLSLF
ncbi:MAG: radical SAM protein, partial [Clostridiales bacterium]|nr:radical SAM protein [Clostridiales bacterium]